VDDLFLENQRGMVVMGKIVENAAAAAAAAAAA